MTAYSLFHALWGSATDGVSYDKSAWQALSWEVDAVVARAPANSRAIWLDIVLRAVRLHDAQRK